MTNTYYSQVRLDLFPLIDKTYGHAIEFGCGEGNTLKYLKEHRIVENTYGVEIHQPVSKIAKKNVDNFWVGDVETFKIPPKIKFDLVLLPDILEHLVDPWIFLYKLQKHLAPEGEVVVSLPNVAHFMVLTQLLKGDWKYEDSGIMDRTHLHYFTFNSALRMFEETGYRMVSTKYNGGYLPGWKGVLNQIVGNRIRNWFVSQWLFKLRGIK